VGEKTARKIVGAIIIALAVIDAASAGPWEDAAIYNQRGDYAAAAKILRRLAEGGDARAQMSLGAMYNLGRRSDRRNDFLLRARHRPKRQPFLAADCIRVGP
jgi:hypothetical protein